MIEAISQEVFKEGVNDGLDELVKSLEAIDDCEFASFTLCLIKEEVQHVKDKFRISSR